MQETSSLNSLSVDEIYDRFGVPDPNPVVRVDGNPLSPGVPSHIFTPIQSEYKTENIELEEAKLLLNDFGTSFRPSEKSRFESFAPMSVCPPEALFEPDVPLSFASDIWSLGCAIFQLMAIRPLLDDTFCTSQDDITAQQVELQGVMPGKWWSRWEERAKWFDEEGNPLGDPKGVWSWERRLREWVMEPRQHYDMDAPDDEEKTALLELLKTVLAWKPTDRPSAQEVLSMPWMTKWALPTYEKARKTWA